MTVNVSGKEYVIEELLLGGEVPAWKLIKQGGVPVTHELFNNLPEADKRALTEHVQQ